MGKSFKLAWRNMWRNWRRTAIALVAIVLGLVLLIFFDGFIQGSDQAIFGNAVNLDAILDKNPDLVILYFFKPDERDQIRRQLAATLQGVICQRMIAKVGGGIVPALAIMINTPTVRKLLEENRLEKLAAAIETGSDDGMQTFNQALFNLVKQGKVSEKEALSKATNPEALKMNFQGIFLDEARRILS